MGPDDLQQHRPPTDRSVEGTGAALRESEAQLRAILEVTTDYAIFTTDPNGVIQDWFPGAQAVFGWQADEIVGQSFAVTYTEQDRAAGVPEQELEGARRLGAVPNVRWHQRNDGTQVFIDGVARARFDDAGTYLGLLKIGQDVTERRMAEQRQADQHAATQRDLEQRIATATADLRALSRRLIAVQEEERRFLARELHDEIGQVLTGLGLLLGQVTATQERLVEAQRVVAELTEQVRQLSVELRPAVLDHYGVLAAVQWLLTRLKARSGFQVTLQASLSNERFEPAIEIAAFRIVQEALTNVIRHAGVWQATVSLEADAEHLRIEIHDAGQGFEADQATNGSGLGGIRDRVELLSGEVTVTSIPGDGTTLIALIPLENEELDVSTDG